MCRFAGILLLLFALVSCKPMPYDAAPDTVLYQDQGLSVLLTPGNAPVESPLLLTVMAQDITAIEGHLTGVSMYMGEIPLRFSPQGAQWQAEFFLGACSEPHMQWQLQMQVSFSDGKKMSLTERFNSSW